MHTVSRAIVYAAAIVATLGSAAAQSEPTKPVARYNSATEVTLQGIVEQLYSRQAKLVPAGSHISLRTSAGAFDVQLGPYFEPTENLVQGETIQVTGSLIKTLGEAVVLAREVKAGGRVFTIRNANGFPLGRRNSPPRQQSH